MVKRLIVQIPLVVVQILLLKLLLLLFARWRHVWWGNVMADMFFPLLAERVVDLLLLLLLELLLLSWCRLWGRRDMDWVHGLARCAHRICLHGSALEANLVLGPVDS